MLSSCFFFNMYLLLFSELYVSKITMEILFDNLLNWEKKRTIKEDLLVSFFFLLHGVCQKGVSTDYFRIKCSREKSNWITCFKLKIKNLLFWLISSWLRLTKDIKNTSLTKRIDKWLYNIWQDGNLLLKENFNSRSRFISVRHNYLYGCKKIMHYIGSGNLFIVFSFQSKLYDNF